ncbi:MAG: hypothetical protein R3C03_13640 [Pirellulaceae bacterium]
MYVRTILLAFLLLGSAIGFGQESDKQQRYDTLSKEMSGVKFIGNFTVSGRENGKLTPEEYTIVSTEKLDSGDLWVITARIKYGDHDLTVPMTMEIKWAGETPVITVDQMTIPGFGTFDARVLVHEGQYSGTWKHGEVGGHLFGTIEKLTAEELEAIQNSRRRSRKRFGFRRRRLIEQFKYNVCSPRKSITI